MCWIETNLVQNNNILITFICFVMKQNKNLYMKLTIMVPKNDLVAKFIFILTKYRYQQSCMFLFSFIIKKNTLGYNAFALLYQ
jgi:hypothetical protein